MKTDADPDAISGATFPTRPRFTLDELREIRIARGDGDSTIAGYTFSHAGKTVDKYATFDTLTHAEREAALLFILKYGGTAAIRRRGKPRGRSAPRIHDQQGGAIKYSQPPELEPIDIDSLTPTDPAAAGFSTASVSRKKNGKKKLTDCDRFCPIKEN